MVVQHKKAGSKGMFFVEYDGDVAAEMIYTMPKEDTMLIEHTEVGEALRGKNVGFEMVHAGVEYARHHGLKIVCLCPFAQSVLDKKPEWHDVLDSSGND